MTAIRNFIYLDNDKLNSLYSQVFHGVAEAIVESYFGETQKSNEQKGIGKTVDEKVGEISGTISNKILHDYMYNKFEDKIKEKIVDCNEPESEVCPNSFVKISGKARIEDYDRLKYYLESFNDLGMALAYFQRESLGAKKGNLREYARQNGLQQDKEILNGIKTFIEQFESNGYEVIIDNEGICYRGILNKDYLRISTDDVRMLYGSNPCMEWTMVGQITQIFPQSETDDVVSSIGGENLKQVLLNVFNSLNNVEASFFSYGSGRVYHILPIAIYIDNQI